MNNKKLGEFFDSLESDIDKAVSENDLLAICKRVRNHIAAGNTLDYNYTWYWVIALITGAILVGLGIHFYSMGEREFFETAGWPEGVMIVTPLVIFIGVIVDAAGKAGRSDSLSEYMFAKDVMFDNDITELEVTDDTYDQLKNRFGDFDRGDEQRHIRFLKQVLFTINGAKRTYNYYKFSYVVVTYVPTAVPNGKGGTTIVMQRKETTYYRYGLIGTFPWGTKEVSIKSASGGAGCYSLNHETGSLSFNQIYSVTTNSSLEAAKFLKPAVMLAFEEVTKYASEVNVELNSVGDMCISFEDENLISFPRKGSLESLDAFEQEIASKNHPVKLAKLIEFIAKLEKYNDKNF